MNSLPSCNLLAKGRRHHRRAMLKDPSLAALVNGGGWVIANGHLKVVVPLVDGTVAVYTTTASIEWGFRLSVIEAQAPEFSPSERIKGHVNAALNILADVEHRAAHLGSATTAIAAE